MVDKSKPPNDASEWSISASFILEKDDNDEEEVVPNDTNGNYDELYDDYNKSQNETNNNSKEYDNSGNANDIFDK
ncbi:22557_t:CDS:2 [Racocetra persica]|uniref:22557_t:CDS:1 n=1 Tax=Racocetra persica TaxID=160502 RepID=A0ACA9RRL6_9GLOM|nr:22557_t:CDS:2 [Racocetra persica]